MIKAFEISNVIMHIILIASFIGIFFFTAGSYLEKKVIKSQIDYLIESINDPIKIFLPLLSKDNKNSIQNFNINIDNEINKKAENNNNKIKALAFKVILIGFIIGLFIIYIISKIMDKEGLTTGQFFKKLIQHNLISLIFIAITYTAFSFGYAQHYMLIDVNKIKYSSIKTLQDIKNFYK